MARYSAHHRSLYPHLESVRGHYLLTSHAGTPLACWDRRWVWAEGDRGTPPCQGGADVRINQALVTAVIRALQSAAPFGMGLAFVRPGRRGRGCLPPADLGCSTCSAARPSPPSAAR